MRPAAANSGQRQLASQYLRRSGPTEAYEGSMESQIRSGFLGSWQRPGDHLTVNLNVGSAAPRGTD